MNNSGGMPQPRLAPTLERLSPSLSEDALFARFMREFGDTSRAEFLDLAGNPLIVDRNLFLNRKNEWKIMKGERAPWLLYTAINIKEPDEIWLEPGRRGGADKLYFFSRFDVERRGFLACLAVFEREQGALGMWAGKTNYATTQFGYIERKRNVEIIDARMLYRRRD
ncbi:PBECR2 nuclease fold domain-containing protein [Thiocystis minor]|uniref:PBECR2 nuclease fold domain-containing protein n=1 Tax=Thiocystis minor TaxID=61597 RepID=UPI0019113708